MYKLSDEAKELVKRFIEMPEEKKAIIYNTTPIRVYQHNNKTKKLLLLS